MYSPAAVAATVAPAVQAAVSPANLPALSLPPLVSFPSVPIRSREDIAPFGDDLKPSQQYVWNPPVDFVSVQSPFNCLDLQDTLDSRS
jgi:hypothetical protein